MPTFPVDSFRRGSQGVAVARVELTETGEVSAVTVLQSPDESISKAVSEALFKWSFKPANPPDHRPMQLMGKLTFYFVIRQGRPHVENPKLFSKT